MRVISQDGKYDIPYDLSVINIDYRDNKNIVFNNVGCVDCVIAFLLKQKHLRLWKCCAKHTWV